MKKEIKLSELSTEQMGLFPEMARDIIDFIGFDNAVKLLEAFGGRSLKLPRSDIITPTVKLIQEVIGEEATKNFVAAFSGEAIYIPRCTHAIRQLRYDKFKQEATALQEAGDSKTTAIMKLCLKYGFSDRWGWKVLNETY